MGANFTWEWLRAQEAKRKPKGETTPVMPPDATLVEQELHNQIIGHCKSNAWIYFHGSMAHSTFRTVGEPDFVILGRDGKFLMIECKTKTGKLSPEQIAMGAWAESLGHKIHVVRSFSQYLEICHGAGIK